MNRIASANRIVFIGGSSGGIEAIRDVLASLPADFPAPILVVIHTGPNSPGLLPQVLQRSTPLLVLTAENGAAPKASRVYVAPPNRHLVVESGVMRLLAGPVENRHRPAIDPLFRSAARTYGPRAVGIILSGYLDDGSAGLFRISQRGGVTIVQEPDDAIVPDMPQAAIERVQPDHIVPVGEMGELLLRLVQQPLAQAAREGKTMTEAEEEKSADVSVFTCPQCHGTLWEAEEGGTLRFKCRVGHAFTADTMLEDQADDVERALWAALRVMEEHAEMSSRLLERARAHGHELAQRHYQFRAEEAARNATVLRELLVHGKQEPKPARPLDEAEEHPGSPQSNIA